MKRMQTFLSIENNLKRTSSQIRVKKNLKISFKYCDIFQSESVYLSQTYFIIYVINEGRKMKRKKNRRILKAYFS